MHHTPSHHPVPSSFSLDAQPDGEDMWVLVSGELDLASDEDLRLALSSVELGQDGTVWLHLAELEFADAASVRQLVGFIRLAREAGREVGVVGVQGVILRMVNLLGLERELDVA